MISEDKRMALKELTSLAEYGFFGLLIILVGLIRIPTININLWAFLARSIGRAINAEVIQDVKDSRNESRKDIADLRKDLDSHREVQQLEAIRNVRQQILRFNDEILFNRKHSQEHFEEILDDINIYEKFCKTHDDYTNNKADFAIDNIKQTYRKCLQEKDFLAYEEEKKFRTVKNNDNEGNDTIS